MQNSHVITLMRAAVPTFARCRRDPLAVHSPHTDHGLRSRGKRANVGTAVSSGDHVRVSASAEALEAQVRVILEGKPFFGKVDIVSRPTVGRWPSYFVRVNEDTANRGSEVFRELTDPDGTPRAGQSKAAAVGALARLRKDAACSDTREAGDYRAGCVGRLPS